MLEIIGALVFGGVGAAIGAAVKGTEVGQKIDANLQEAVDKVKEYLPDGKDK